MRFTCVVDCEKALTKGAVYDGSIVLDGHSLAVVIFTDYRTWQRFPVDWFVPVGRFTGEP